MPPQKGRQGIDHGHKEDVYVLMQEFSYVSRKGFHRKTAVHGYPTLAVSPVLLLGSVRAKNHFHTQAVKKAYPKGRCAPDV